MFCVGQTVLYGSNGVCMVDDVTEKRIGKTKMQYYVLKPLCNNTSTLFVPTANQQLVSKMRRILTVPAGNGENYIVMQLTRQEVESWEEPRSA